MKDTLYIHTNLYDAEVSREKFFKLIEYQHKYIIYKEVDEIQKLYSIFCFDDGLVRFSIINNEFEHKKLVVDILIEDFSTYLNEFLEKNFLNQKIS